VRRDRLGSYLASEELVVDTLNLAWNEYYKFHETWEMLHVMPNSRFEKHFNK
jgi:hypothetical protein